MGMKERDGQMVAQSIPNIKKRTLWNVEPGSAVSTHGLLSYGLRTSNGCKHGTVKCGDKEWACYDYQTDAWSYVNSVESFWHLFKHQCAARLSTPRASTWTGIGTSLRSGRTIAQRRRRSLIC